MRMRRKPRHNGLAQLVKVVREGGHFVAEHPGVDEQHASHSPDIVYFDVIPPHQFVGADAVRRNFLRWFAEYQGDIKLDTHDLSIAVSGDVAFAHMLHPDSGTRRNGRDITVVVRSTVCLRRIDGQWLITHEHISFPVNPGDWSAVVDAAP
jgi:ketosteroid isomerase-like protein